jgi:poly(3-hydroxybutyrate) depolymerase
MGRDRLASNEDRLVQTNRVRRAILLYQPVQQHSAHDLTISEHGSCRKHHNVRHGSICCE